MSTLRDVRDIVGDDGLLGAFEQAMVLLEWNDRTARSAAEFGFDGEAPIEPRIDSDGWPPDDGPES